MVIGNTPRRDKTIAYVSLACILDKGDSSPSNPSPAENCNRWIYVSKADLIAELWGPEIPDQRKDFRPYLSSPGSSGARGPSAHKTYTMNARRRDILQAAGEASSEANQPTDSSQDTVRESQKWLRHSSVMVTNLGVEWPL